MAKKLSAEQFEALLIEVRDGAFDTLSDMADESIVEGEQHRAKIEDARDVAYRRVRARDAQPGPIRAETRVAAGGGGALGLRELLGPLDDKGEK